MKEHIKVTDVYPITTIRYPNGAVVSGVMDVHLQQYTAPVRLPELEQELVGQTRGEAGAYPGDVERWLNKLPVVD